MRPSTGKTIAKRFAAAAAAAAVLPWLFTYCLARLVCGREKSFAGHSEGLSLLPGTVGVYLRREFYKRTLPRCGEGSVVSFGVLLTHPDSRLGRDVYAGPFTTLGRVDIGDDALIASHVSIINGGRQHGIDRLDVPIREQSGVYPLVAIGRGCWIGERAVVMADVGEGAVVAAGAVVTRPVPPLAIVAGVPARVIGSRSSLTGPVNGGSETYFQPPVQTSAQH